MSLSACGGRLTTEPHPLLSQTAAPRREMALDGALVAIPKPGHVTLVDFWATSCKPCVQMMPAIEALSREQRARGLVVVGVATDDNPGLVQEALRKLGVTYPNLVDAEGGLRGAFRVADVPQTLIFDRHGQLRVARTGGDAADLAAIRGAVDVLLGEP